MRCDRITTGPQQLGFGFVAERRTPAIPDLASYDWVALSSSAGKDSQAMIDHVVQLARDQGCPLSKLVVVHADLGRAEWPGCKQLAQAQAEHYGLPFRAVKRPQGELPDHIRQRGKFPSSVCRFCTSDHKRNQIGKEFVQLHRQSAAAGKADVRILNCMGLRAEESPGRAKKNPDPTRNERASTRSRHVDDWLPIHHWTEKEVWARIGWSKVPYHYAYDLGMPRLSCVMCIFAPKAALVIAGRHNPDVFAEYVAIEKEIRHTFRQDLSLQQVQEAIESQQEIEAAQLHGAWNM